MRLFTFFKVAGVILAIGGIIFLGWKMFASKPLLPPSQPKVIAIIQYLPLLDSAVDGFKEGMAQLGYVEEKDVVYAYHTAEGDKDKVREIARDVIMRDVDLIYTVTSVAARGILEETVQAGRTDIPIVYAHADNPVKTNLAEDLKSSGNNATGIAVDLTELTAKRLEISREFKPSMTRLGVFITLPSVPAGDFMLEELREQAPRQEIILVEYVLETVPGPIATEKLKGVLDTIKPREIDAFIAIPSPITSDPENTGIIADAGKRLQIPTIGLTVPQAEAGFLFAYGYDLKQLGHQASVIADKIIKGTKPTDIPIEFPQKNMLIVNSKTADEIGIALPETVYLIADMIIER